MDDEALRARFPEEAARLERSWRTAVEVRRRLLALGPEGRQAVCVARSDTALTGHSPYQAARSLQEQIREKQLNELDDLRGILQRLGS